eukprot:8056829-Pyramimonas_sp.AAC.1
MWLSPLRRALLFLTLQEFRRLRAVPFQHMALALAPRAFVCTICKSFTVSHDQRTRDDVFQGFKIMRVQQLRWFAVLTSQE